jgi:hypothetical protein
MRLPILLTLLFFSCYPQTQEGSSVPKPLPDTDLCKGACEHIGASGLNCEEGQSVYDSDTPGPKDVPNMPCETFCRMSQDRGAFFNPRCLILVPSCDQIEEFRVKNPRDCE